MYRGIAVLNFGFRVLEFRVQDLLNPQTGISTSEAGFVLGLT